MSTPSVSVDDTVRTVPRRSRRLAARRNRLRAARFQYLDTPYRSPLHSTTNYCDGILTAMKYLSMKDWLHVARVNKLFHSIASESTLWETVNMDSSPVTNWDEFVETLNRFGTKHLNMSGMAFPTEHDEVDRLWGQILGLIPRIPSLEALTVRQCSVPTLTSLTSTLPNIKVLHADYVRYGVIDMDNYSNLNSLRELKIKAATKLLLTKDIRICENFKQLTLLSLTGIDNMNGNILEVVDEIEGLRVLELGNCNKFPIKFNADTLSGLTHLEKLRLEKLNRVDSTYSIFDVISKLKQLSTLELINFEVNVGFTEAVSKCENIKNLMLIPSYMSRAIAVSQVIHGIRTLRCSLARFAFGVTMELFQDTDLVIETNALGFIGPIQPGRYVPTLISTEYTCISGNSMCGILNVDELVTIFKTFVPFTRFKLFAVWRKSTWYQHLSNYFD